MRNADVRAIFERRRLRVAMTPAPYSAEVSVVVQPGRGTPITAQSHDACLIRQVRVGPLSDEQVLCVSSIAIGEHLIECPARGFTPREVLTALSGGPVISSRVPMTTIVEVLVARRSERRWEQDHLPYDTAGLTARRVTVGIEGEVYDGIADTVRRGYELLVRLRDAPTIAARAAMADLGAEALSLLDVVLEEVGAP